MAAVLASAFGFAPCDARGAGQDTIRVSDEVSVSRWAYAESDAAVRAAPASSAAVIGRLRFRTVHGQALPYLALLRTVGESSWTQVRIPGRTNASLGWVPSDALGPLHRVRGRVIVDRRRLRVTLFDGRGRSTWSAPVGIGRAGLRTPSGRFVVTEKLRSLDPAYGPYAIGTSAYAPRLKSWPGGGVVGLHGTNRPELVPGHPSHGCVRLRNADITALWRRVRIGTPILITGDPG